MTNKSEHPAPRPPSWWRVPFVWVRRWLLSGGCSACKTHEDDAERWRRELADQRGETPERSDHSR